MNEKSAFEDQIVHLMSKDVCHQEDGWHPDLSLLLDWLMGSLPEEIAIKIRAHEIVCRTCRARIFSLREAQEKTIPELHRTASKWTFPAFRASFAETGNRQAQRLRNARRWAVQWACAAGSLAALSFSIPHLVARSQLLARGEGIGSSWPFVLTLAGGVILGFVAVLAWMRKKK